MRVRVNISTEYEAQSYLIDTENISNDTVREAIEFTVQNPSASKSFGDRIEVINGHIIQSGYEMNEYVRGAQIEEDVPSVSVETSY